MSRILLTVSISFLLLFKLGCRSEASQSKGLEALPEPEFGEIAILAGGCFWCMEPPYAELGGILEMVVGFSGGNESRPRYSDVVRGRTGHLEAVRLVYDPAVISFEEILIVFWQQIDPTDATGQFADRGAHYSTAIFYSSESQKSAAVKSKELLDNSGVFNRPIVTEIRPAMAFYPAEEEHQGFFQKQPQYYQRYATGSGRVGFVNRHAERVADALASLR